MRSPLPSHPAQMAVLFGAWFVGNTIRNGLVSTGAFEISYGGTQVWSKLDTGAMPSLGELVARIGEAMAAAAQ